ncbi:hypothetical protein N9383_05760 [Granulosicoccus sp.]|nr:hypothetical protein [Granulosicoccus sp.]MDC0434174.1 hypothetical protein [bacterium]
MQSKILWQQAAGDTSRNYAKICLDWNVILNGPGYTGHWSTGEKILKEEGWTSRKLTDLRRFAEEMKSGDLVVLRLGTSQVCGVGEVVGNYEWSDAFGDIDGWDLQHVRRVRWFWKLGDQRPAFKKYAMKQGDTTQKLKNGAVFDWVQTLSVPDEKPALIDLPGTDDMAFEFEALSEYLFEQGVASDSIENLLKEVGELTRIAKWYKKYDNPSESETVAYLAVPLLRALGWTPQKMAIEWNRVDVALFEKLPRSDEVLAVVVEAKRKDASCLSAMSQAETYARLRPSCNRLIVTDGIRFGVFIKREDKFELHAYMNLTRLRNKNPAYRCAGVNEAMLAMTPEWNGT